MPKPPPKNRNNNVNYIGIDQESLYRYLARGNISLISITSALVVADYLNFRKAGNALGVAQSAVSARIADLEEALGIQIFERQRGVYLTASGKVFLDLAFAAVTQIGRALETTSLHLGTQIKTVRVGVQSSVAAGTLVEILSDFKTAYPNISLDPIEATSRSMMHDLRRRKLDVIFAPKQQLAGDNDHDVLTSLPLWQETVIVALSADDPLAHRSCLAWAELASKTFLVREDGIGDCLMEFALPHLIRKRSQPHIRSLRIGRDTMLAAVARTQAVALTCDTSTAIHVPGIVFRPIGPEPLLVTFHAIWSRHNSSRPLQDFLEIARKIAPKKNLHQSHP